MTEHDGQRLLDPRQPVASFPARLGKDPGSRCLPTGYCSRGCIWEGHMKRVIGVVVALMGLLVAAPSQFAEAGAPGGSLDITVNVNGGPDNVAAATAITPVVTDTNSAAIVCNTPHRTLTAGTVTNVNQFCNGNLLSDGMTYTVSLTGVPADYYISSGDCVAGQVSTGLGLSFVGDSNVFFECTVEVSAIPSIYADVEVLSGTAAPSDFAVNLATTEGGTPTATTTDPAATTCSDSDLDTAKCAKITTVPGTSFLSATGVAGYALSHVTCADAPGGSPVIASNGAVAHGAGNLDTLCTISVRYVTQTISVDVVIINDEGGTAAAADFTIEVRDSTNAIVASGVDPEPGINNASFTTVQPIGEYTVTVSGPTGYTTEIVDTQVPDGAERFQLVPNNNVAVVVTANDPAPLATTSTTVAPTTVDPNAVLPATGSASSMVLMWALAAFFLGSGTVLIARRP